MERDRFFSAEQAMQYGLIDKVLDTHLSDPGWGACRL